MAQLTPDPGPPADGIPSGPWLLVTGMHRSGTSGVTGVLGALGWATPSADDRVDWPESNPEHWESLALTVFDDRLLDRLGGSWDAPPELADGWEGGSAALDVGDPVTDLRGAFPDPGPLVWKDPRLCLLYPYWRRVLPTPVAAVLVWRSPAGVADSLHRRDGMDPILGLALWERYNRAALVNLDGVDTYLIHYERLLAEPEVAVSSLATWLGSLEQFAGLDPATRVAEAVATLTGTDRPGALPSTEPEPDEGPDLLAGQRQLVEYLSAHQGGHRPLRTPELGGDSPWATAIIRARREFRSRELDDAQRMYESNLAAVQAVADYWEQAVGAMTDSTSWKVTRPLRSVVARLQGNGRPG